MIRLYVSDPLCEGGRIGPTPEQTHYLLRVMRLAVNAPLLVFNGRDGEWRARLAEVGKRGCVLAVGDLARPQAPVPDVDLIVALVKRGQLETIIEKATELGARRVLLAITERTNVDHANVARLAAIAVEAAEQTGRLDAPEVAPPRTLTAILGNLEGRHLMFCDEAGDAAPVAVALGGAAPGPWAVLVGPEGGFSAAERAMVRARALATPVSLGPRILRADTAAIAALTLWQSALGDLRLDARRAK